MSHLDRGVRAAVAAPPEIQLGGTGGSVLRTDRAPPQPQVPAFLRVLAEGLERYPVELLALTWMPNHWPMVLRPATDGLMGWMLR